MEAYDRANIYRIYFSGESKLIGLPVQY